MAAVKHAQDAPALVWLRQDLRLDDNPALLAAARFGRPLACVYVLDDETPGRWAWGGASRWWLHGSLEAMARALAELGVPLILRRGNAADVIPALAAETKAALVAWNRRYEPLVEERDAAIQRALRQAGVEARSFNGSLLFEPWDIRTREGGGYQVFTPFWRAARAAGLPADPSPAPRSLTGAALVTPSDALDAWALRPSRPDWAGGLRDAWTPGEAGARARFDRFLAGALGDYATGRDRPGTDGVSRLSPALHWGEISPRRVVSQIIATAHESGREDAGERFLAEIGWREFAHHLLHNHPDLPERNHARRFDALPWRDDKAAIRAWTRGRTGYPMVDAGMRELMATGWMHNRARMIAGSFLVKHLLVDWRVGAAWFWDTLVDADLANNAMGWQWAAGSGADAAPYFRIFNPVAQGRRFDADGAYVRRWVPELAGLDARFVHQPWAAPETTLARAGVRLGRDYPRQIVDHGEARARALAAWDRVKAAA